MPAGSLCCVFADFSEKKSQTMIWELQLFEVIYTVLLLVREKREGKQNKTNKQKKQITLCNSTLSSPSGIESRETVIGSMCMIEAILQAALQGSESD